MGKSGSSEADIISARRAWLLRGSRSHGRCRRRFVSFFFRVLHLNLVAAAVLPFPAGCAPWIFGFFLSSARDFFFSSARDLPASLFCVFSLFCLFRFFSRQFRFPCFRSSSLRRVYLNLFIASRFLNPHCRHSLFPPSLSFPAMRACVCVGC